MPTGEVLLDFVDRVAVFLSFTFSQKIAEFGSEFELEGPIISASLVVDVAALSDPLFHPLVHLAESAEAVCVLISRFGSSKLSTANASRAGESDGFTKPTLDGDVLDRLVVLETRQPACRMCASCIAPHPEVCDCLFG